MWVEATRGDPYCPAPSIPPSWTGVRGASRAVTCMDLTIHRPHAICALTGRHFVAGEPFFSALVRSQSGLERHDFAADAWSGPPADTLAWWRSTYPSAASSGEALAPADVLLDVVEELEDSDADAALRYLVSLELVRRRVLRFVDHPVDTDRAPSRPADRAEGPRHLVFACRKRDREYRVRMVSPAEAAAPGVEERLMSLLWSGGAA